MIVDREAFEILEDGATYLLPRYSIDPTVGLYPETLGQQIDMVGFNHSGVIHESLLAMMIHDLKLKQSKLASKETACTITHLEEALHWQNARTARMEKEKKKEVMLP